MKLANNDLVMHRDRPEWGVGGVLKDTDGDEVHVDFKHEGKKVLKLEYAKLLRVPNYKPPDDPKPFAEEIKLLKKYLNDPADINRNELAHLIFYKQSILDSLQQLSEYFGSEPTIDFPAFTPWTKHISLGTNSPELQKQLLAKFRTLEKRQHKDYLKAKKEYKAIIAKISAEIKEQQKNIASYVDVLKKLTLSKEKVPWELLPPGKHQFHHIVNHFKKLSNERTYITYDMSRLDKLYSLRPDSTYIGTGGFKGYVVFYFRPTSTAVLECPVEGNAIYIIKGEWKELSRKSKAELLDYHSKRVNRIIHRGNWFRRLKASLKQRKKT